MTFRRGFVLVILLIGITSTALAPSVLQLRAEGADGKLRIVHFGDSHTAADTLQIALRQRFQQNMGDGGIGLFLPCTTRASRCSKGWTIQARPLPAFPDEFLGLPGMLLQTSLRGESIQVDGDFSTVRAFFLKQPGGGRVRFFVNGATIGDLDLSGNSRQPVPFIARLPYDGRQRLEIRTLGGAVRLLSLSLENSMSGVVYSPLGVIGARLEDLLHIDEKTFATQLAWESPDVVILAYGTNESSGAGVDEAVYSLRVGEMVERIRRAVPNARVLLVGPPDRGVPGSTGSLAALSGVIRGIEAAAWRKNVPFLNLQAAMGGPGTTARWSMADPPLGKADRTHFTPLGYQRLAGYIAGAVKIPTSVHTTASTMAKPGIYRVRGADGHLIFTNDPATVQTLIARGGKLQGN